LGSSITIGSNPAVLQTGRYLGRASSALNQSFSRLSSGMRIVHASDDAAGLAISKLLEADSQVLGQATRNVSDGISALQIADGVVQELSNIVTRLGELAEQAANGTLSLTQRKPLQAEADQLVKEYERIAGSAEFNNIRLLYNAQASIGVQSGYGSANTLNFGLGSELSRNNGTGTYTRPISFSAPANDSATTADFNGDGIADLAFSAATNTAVVLGNGDGTFAAVRTYSSGGVTNVNDIQSGDFNGDGIADLVLSSNSNLISILQGNGNGTFKSAVSVSLGVFTFYSIEVADLNNDGRDDLVTAHSTGLGAYQSTAAGLFTSVSTFSNSSFSPQEVNLVDVNNDGSLDIVAKQSASALGRVFLGNGNGTFGAVTTITAGAGGLGLGDYNRDGILDLFNSEANGFSVSLGTGTGTFSSKTTFAIGGINSALLEVRDLTGDGILDVVSTIGTDLQVYRGNSDGTFGYSPSSVLSGTRSGHLAIADFNQDGALEIAGGGSSTYDITSANTAKSSTASYLYLLSADGARDSLSLVSSAQDRIAKERGVIGAYQERLTANFSVLQQNREQLITAAASIQSADVAEETANLVRNKILMQAGTAILAQAAQSPQIALNLLGINSARG
jgi:flagellin